MKCTIYHKQFFLQPVSLQMQYCLTTLLVHMALDFNSVNDFVYAISKLDLIQIDFNYKTQAFGQGFLFLQCTEGPFLFEQQLKERKEEEELSGLAERLEHYVPNFQILSKNHKTFFLLNKQKSDPKNMNIVYSNTSFCEFPTKKRAFDGTLDHYFTLNEQEKAW